MQWLMLQQDKPEDFVISTGRMETVRRFVELAAKKLGWESLENSKSIIWEGENENEIGRRADTKEIVVRVDPRYFRPAEVDQLLGDATKAKEKLNWVSKTSLEDLVGEMIENDLEQAQKDLYLKEKGYDSPQSIDFLN